MKKSIIGMIAFSAVWLVLVPYPGRCVAQTQETQGSLKQLDMGLCWLSVEELARYGIKLVLKKLPLN